MLSRLTIRNYALIRHLELRPSSNLTVITGETGAGKSIMLGALGLLLGNRADTKVLWDENEKCVTEAIFEIKAYRMKRLFDDYDLDYSDQTILRREITPSGKSRAFINDTPVTLEVMRKIGSRLMDIHSQHETLELGSHQFQLSLIDGYAGNGSIMQDYDQAWKAYQEARKKFETLQAESGRLKAEYELVRFQLNELQKAGFKEGEQESLEVGLKMGEHGEDIKTRLNALVALLGQSEQSVDAVLGEALHLLQPIRNISTSLEQLASRLNSARIELKDILAETQQEEEKVEFDPRKTKEIQERLDTLYGLLQKHRARGITELLALQESLAVQADKTVHLDDDLKAAQSRLDTTQKEVEKIAALLTAARKKARTPLVRQLTELLKGLGIPDASLQIELGVTAQGPAGSDRVEILFSANKGIPPQPLEQIASGGEFSRVMFCVKFVMAEKASLPTLVLDEIDTGVSGEIAIQLGRMMQSMAQRHQVIAISHLPQIAARGDRHYLVYKDSSHEKTVSDIRPLDQEERIEEIAKMIGGTRPSRTAVENAKELMAMSTS
ncbi:MAG: DNA repair protein RecN [Bacteroidetes bacterium]|nr:DNA repair protein RecN [Bacteroidota bacterium]